MWYFRTEAADKSVSLASHGAISGRKMLFSSNGNAFLAQKAQLLPYMCFMPMCCCFAYILNCDYH